MLQNRITEKKSLCQYKKTAKERAKKSKGGEYIKTTDHR